MLTPDYLYHVSDSVIELYEQLNTFAIQDICRRLVNADFQFTGSIDWQLYKLQQSGMVMNDITAAVVKLTKKSEQEIAAIFEEATYKSQTYDNEVYAKAGLKPIDIRQSPQMLKILQAAYSQTMGELKNFTRTTASAGQTLFLETMDEVAFRVMGGQQSYTEAVRQAINKVSSNGLVIHYPTGHTDSIETAVRRCVVTGAGQATARVSLQNAQEMDTDLVLVSAHLGARPSHAEWQGKIFSISGNNKKYMKLSDATGYGAVTGLCGANCRHHFMPYIEGISTNPYENFSSKENNEYYNNQQAQRKKERDIRATKRELQALHTSIDATRDDKLKFALQQEYDKKAARLRAQNNAYKDFCKKAGLQTQQERLQVAGWGNSAAAGVREAAKRYEHSLGKEYRIICADGKTASIKQRMDVQRIISSLPEKAGKALEPALIKVNSPRGSGYAPIENTVYISQNATRREIIHEFGHVFENTIFDTGKTEALKREAVKGLTIDDIIIKTGTDSMGVKKEVFLLNSDRFIDAYQSRLYVDDIFDAIDPEGGINIHVMGEFVSVAVEYYFMFPKSLKKWYPDMYKLVEEAFL